MSADMVLVAMRLVDMGKIHPYQDNSKACSRCGQRVGIYPSGQNALKANPGMTIICADCAMNESKNFKSPDAIEIRPAGSWDEIAQEMRDSQPASKA